VSSYTIGTLARAAGVTVETVRYYERRGLLEQPDRGDGSGYRQYSDDDVARLAFVRRAKALGFTLAEIRSLLGASECGSVAGVLAAAEAKLAGMDEELRRLTATRERLRSLVQICADGDDNCVALEIS